MKYLRSFVTALPPLGVLFKSRSYMHTWFQRVTQGKAAVDNQHTSLALATSSALKIESPTSISLLRSSTGLNVEAGLS